MRTLADISACAAESLAAEFHMGTRHLSYSAGQLGSSTTISPLSMRIRFLCFRLVSHLRQFARQSLHLVYFRLALLVVRRSISNILDSEVQRFFQHCDLGLCQLHSSSVSLIIFHHNMGGIRHFGEQEGTLLPFETLIMTRLPRCAKSFWPSSTI